MMPPYRDRVSAAVGTLPEKVRSALSDELARGARIGPAATDRLLGLGDWDVEELMIRLLPVARAYADPPVSEFHVGAVARIEDLTGETSLILGCNVETPGLPLAHTIHAEQAAAARAFHAGAERVLSIAVTAAPCGHCRQFLHELSTRRPPDILIPTENGPRSTSLAQLLPRAFGPADLGVDAGVLDDRSEAPLTLGDDVSGDPLVAAALDAARRSYAPYSGNFAGIALNVGSAVVRGSYLENAAFNPGLTPMHVAMINLRLGTAPGLAVAIRRAVLVEAAAECSQAPAAAELLGVLAPGVELEVHRAPAP